MKCSSSVVRALILTAGTLTTICNPSASAQVAVSPQRMKILGEVDPRFVSYNVEAVEVTGGRFWAPYKSAAQTAAAGASDKGSGDQPAGIDSSFFQYRPPIDLSSPKLRKLALGLGPAYVRVSGTWRNSTYFQNNDDPPVMSLLKASTVSSRARSGRGLSSLRRP